jgi:hypothetical protein
MMIKRIFVLSLLFFLITLIISFLTKTTSQEFNEKAMTQWKEYNQTIAKDPVMEDVAELQNSFIEKALSHLVQEKDFFFFKTFTLQLADGEYKYLGVFHQVIPLQKDNPLENFYHENQN